MWTYELQVPDTKKVLLDRWLEANDLTTVVFQDEGPDPDPENMDVVIEPEADPEEPVASTFAALEFKRLPQSHKIGMDDYLSVGKNKPVVQKDGEGLPSVPMQIRAYMLSLSKAGEVKYIRKQAVIDGFVESVGGDEAFHTSVTKRVYYMGRAGTLKGWRRVAVTV